MPKKSLLGEILMNKGVITEEQLHQALVEQKKSNKRLGRVLIDLGIVSEEVMINYLSNQMADILEEYESNAPHLMSKSHEWLITHKKIPWGEKEREKEIYRRLSAGREKLLLVKEMFKKRIYREVIFYAYHAMHHITRLAHELQGYQNYLSPPRKIGVKSVYTGRTGTSQVEWYSIFAEKIAEEATNPLTKHYARSIIKDTESYLKRIEKIFYQRKKEIE